MKATHWMMYTLLGITLLLTACVDDDKDLSQPKEPEKTTDLIIPDDADWTTTRSVNLSKPLTFSGSLIDSSARVEALLIGTLITSFPLPAGYCTYNARFAFATSSSILLEISDTGVSASKLSSVHAASV